MKYKFERLRSRRIGGRLCPAYRHRPEQPTNTKKLDQTGSSAGSQRVVKNRRIFVDALVLWGMGVL